MHTQHMHRNMACLHIETDVACVIHISSYQENKYYFGFHNEIIYKCTFLYNKEKNKLILLSRKTHIFKNIFVWPCISTKMIFQ